MSLTLFFRLKEAQLSVKRITGDKKVETRKIYPNSLVRQDSGQTRKLRDSLLWVKTRFLNQV